MRFSYKKLTFGLIIVLTTAITACSKGEKSTPEPTITIDILSPAEGTEVQRGDTMLISATVSSPVDLHGYQWRIIDKVSGAELKVASDHSHQKAFTISGNFVNNVTETTTANLEITVEADHEGQQASSIASIILN